MDDRRKRRVRELANALETEEKDRLARLGTFVEIENLTAEIGDELAKQLAQKLYRRQLRDFFRLIWEMRA